MGRPDGNANGNFLRGFYYKVTSSNILWAEKWSIFLGLRMAWNLSIPKMIMEVDSKVATDIII